MASKDHAARIRAPPGAQPAPGPAARLCVAPAGGRLLRQLVGAAIVVVGAGVAAGWVLSAPVKLDAATLAGLMS